MVKLHLKDIILRPLYYTELVCGGLATSGISVCFARTQVHKVKRDRPISPHDSTYNYNAMRAVTSIMIFLQIVHHGHPSIDDRSRVAERNCFLCVGHTMISSLTENWMKIANE